VQADRLAYFCQRRSGFLRSGEALSPRFSRSFNVSPVVKLGALGIGESFPFGVP
jgi:hypothetical protein